MNEYIILNLCDPDNKEADLKDKTVVPISRIKRFFVGRSEITRMILYPVYPQTEFEKFEVKESPTEIESLIMGERSKPKKLPEVWLDKDGQTYPVYPPTEATYSLSEVNALKEDLQKLKEVNKTLRERRALRQEEYLEIVKAVTELDEKLEHSNPDNPCCRETFEKAHRLWVRLGISNQEHSELTKWKNLFLEKIEETKNDSL